MFNEHRNWKWMVPAAGIPVMIIVWNWFMEQGWGDWGILPLFIAGILVVAALMNGWLYVQSHSAAIFSEFQLARNSTPEVRMFEAARGMHPDAVQALLIHRRAIWRIKYVPFRDVADWILDEAPSVHAGFIDFVLDHSNPVSVMGQHGILSQGSKQFDPNGLIEDRDQYADFILLMQQKLMCTEALGNQPPKWIPPWNPDLVRHRFGLDGDQYVVEHQSEAMAALRRAQTHQGNGNGNGNGKSPAAIHADVLGELEQTAEMKARLSQSQS